MLESQVFSNKIEQLLYTINIHIKGIKVELIYVIVHTSHMF